MPAVSKHSDSRAKKNTIELWRAKVPQRTIMKQPVMSMATLERVLAYAKASSSHPALSLC
jgi:hypothetical protein